jgi:LuxR family maltose regulon positive regulatory protein
LSTVLYEWGQLDEAAKCANQGIELSRPFQNNGALLVGYIVLTRVLTAHGDLTRASESWRQIETIVRTDSMLQSTLKMVEALRARIWLAQGNVADAEQWAKSYERDLSFPVSGDWPGVRQLSRMHDYEFLTLVRIRMAQGQCDEALRLLALFQPVIESGARRASLVEIVAIQALAYQVQGHTPDAMTALKRAILLAEPEGYIRIFVDEGEPMREAIRNLRRDLGSGKKPTELQTRLMRYTDKLLEAFSHNTPQFPIEPANSVVHQPTLTHLISARELEILRLIAEGLSNQAIAQKLFLSISTVKVHVKHIYGKLDVNSRTQAVARLRESDL